MGQALTSSVVAAVHELAAQKVSGRQIAARLGISEASVRRALQRDPTPRIRACVEVRSPTLLSRPIHGPSPCPDSAPAWIRRLYGSLMERGFLSELDALIVFADLSVERTHLCLDVFSTDIL